MSAIVCHGLSKSDGTLTTVHDRRKGSWRLELGMHERWEEQRAEFGDPMKVKVPTALLPLGRLRIAERLGQFLEMGTPAVTVRGATPWSTCPWPSSRAISRVA